MIHILDPLITHWREGGREKRGREGERKGGKEGKEGGRVGREEGREGRKGGRESRERGREGREKGRERTSSKTNSLPSQLGTISNILHLPSGRLLSGFHSRLTHILVLSHSRPWWCVVSGWTSGCMASGCGKWVDKWVC